jgi:hypothetical protein
MTPEILPMMGVSRAWAASSLPAEAAPAAIASFSSPTASGAAAGADPGIVGQSIPLNGEPYEVVGVMPPSFVFAPFWATGQIWAPLGLRRARTSRRAVPRVFAAGTNLPGSRPAESRSDHRLARREFRGRTGRPRRAAP